MTVDERYIVRIDKKHFDSLNARFSSEAVLRCLDGIKNSLTVGGFVGYYEAALYYLNNPEEVEKETLWSQPKKEDIKERIRETGKRGLAKADCSLCLRYKSSSFSCPGCPFDTFQVENTVGCTVWIKQALNDETPIFAATIRAVSWNTKDTLKVIQQMETIREFARWHIVWVDGNTEYKLKGGPVIAHE